MFLKVTIAAGFKIGGDWRAHVKEDYCNTSCETKVIYTTVAMLEMVVNCHTLCCTYRALRGNHSCEKKNFNNEEKDFEGGNIGLISKSHNFMPIREEER